MGVPVKARASTADKVTPTVPTHNGPLAFANLIDPGVSRARSTTGTAIFSRREIGPA